jgi:anti-anti-sigma regulatory factor
MNDDAALWTDREFTLRQRLAGRDGVLAELSGELRIAHVEELAAWADRICGVPVRNVVLELRALTAVDEAGARTLAAACQCLRLHGRRIEVRGLRHEVSQMLDRLGLILADGPAPMPRPRGGPAQADPASAAAS